MSDKPKKAGEKAVVVHIADEMMSSRRRVAADADPPPGQPLKGVPPGQWHDQADELGLPPDCPVKPLGYHGVRPRLYHFIDPNGSLQSRAQNEFGKTQIYALFQGRTNYLLWAWPRWKKDKSAPNGFSVDTFDANAAAAALMDACARAGSWDPTERVRGRGAWKLPGGGIAFHFGTFLLLNGRTCDPGEYDGYVYPELPAMQMKPWPVPVSDEESPARLLLPLLRSWQWERPDIDPVLLFGWMAAAMIGGALDVRPVGYISGDFATGKTTLQELIALTMGDLLLQSVNATEAGVAQTIQKDTLAVSIDEMEPASGGGRAKNLIELARQAYSGGVRLRGGADHKASEFRAQSAFIFSSINEPPLEPQDLSRMVFFRLRRLPEDAPRLKMDRAALHEAGRKMLRRLLEGYHMLPGMIAHWRELLADAGHTARGQDTFGTLLACAELAMGPLAAEELGVPFVDDVARWKEWLAADGLAENENRVENWRLCLEHLLGAQIDALRNGVRPTVASVLEETFLVEMSEQIGIGEARRLLAQAGVGLSKIKRGGGGDFEGWLVIPNRSPVLARVFAGTPWASGGWTTAIRQAERGKVWVSKVAAVGGITQRCTLVDLRAVIQPPPADDAKAAE